MLAGSKRMLSLFEDFELQPNGTATNRARAIIQMSGSNNGCKMELEATYQQFAKETRSHCLSLFNRIFQMLDNRTRIAFYNGLVLPHLDYADTVRGDQPGLKSEMEKLQSFQYKFARKIKLGKMPYSEALKCLNWLPLAARRLSHRCTAVDRRRKCNQRKHSATF